ncbi:MAG: glycosyltransferase [Celeribacter sp.]|jgi:glycosyltransferase involved in cell wall biosynthesis
MRILRVIHSVHPDQGGPVEGLLRSAACHAAQGHQTEVISLDPGPMSGFPLMLHPLGPGLGRYGYTPKLAQWITANAARFDACVIHGLWNHAVIGGGRAARACGLPYVVFTHGMLDPWFRRAAPLRYLAKQVIWWAAQAEVMEGAARVLFTSPGEADAARAAFGQTKIHPHILRYGAARPTPRERMEGPQAFAARVTMPDRPYLLFLSRFHPKKGLDLLIPAFASLAARQPALQLVLAGPDPNAMVPGLRHLAREAGVNRRVHFPGALAGASKWGALLGADALCLPSHGENFGIVLAEAMACATPVLTTHAVNIAPRIASAGAGLIERDDAEGIARLLQRWGAVDPPSRARMAAAAERLHASDFTIEAAATALAEVLSQIRREDRQWALA